MNPTDPDIWKANNDRPAWVRRHRDELQQATGMDIPRSLRELEEWLTPARKGAVTKALTEDADE